jgi:hypothetical protein
LASGSSFPLLVILIAEGFGAASSVLPVIDIAAITYLIAILLLWQSFACARLRCSETN